MWYALILQTPISRRRCPGDSVEDCAKGCNGFRALSPSVDLRNLNRTSFGSSCTSLSPVNCHAAANSLSLRFKVPLIRECARRDALFRDRVLMGTVWFWLVRNHARDCHVIAHALSLIRITLHLPSSRLDLQRRAVAVSRLIFNSGI
jgi:hypothetical protein